MGAWGHDTFDNDTACDWAYDLEECDDLSVIEETLDRVVNCDDNYLDADFGTEGLAACDVIARMRGNWGVRNPYTETVDRWVENHSKLKTDALVPIALRAIDRIVGEESELAELWEEGESDDWLKAVEDLRKRLKA